VLERSEDTEAYSLLEYVDYSTESTYWRIDLGRVLDFGPALGRTPNLVLKNIRIETSVVLEETGSNQTMPTLRRSVRSGEPFYTTTSRFQSVTSVIMAETDD
jgi:hypothetical protein